MLPFWTLCASAASVAQSIDSVEYGRFYVNLRASVPGVSVMDHTIGRPTLRWGFTLPANQSNQQSQNPGCDQSAFRVQLWGPPNATGKRFAYDTNLVASQNQSHTVGVTLPSATLFGWRVSVACDGSAPFPWSANQTFFTATSPNDWGDATPIWAAPNATGTLPAFAFLRSQAPIRQDRTIASALVFITANPPLPSHVEEGHYRPPKILGGYKLWVEGTVVGVGPGRARCGPLMNDQGDACAYGVGEQPFDGHDVTSLATQSPDSTIDVFIVGYGLQHGLNGGPKVQCQLRLTYTDGTTDVLNTGGAGAAWAAFDANSVYNPQGNSGCVWYDYPRENFNVSAAPPNTPLATQHVAQNSSIGAASAWHDAVVQPHFLRELVPKPTAPIQVSEEPLSSVRVVQVGPGRFFFDLGRELQGGVVLSVTLPALLAAASPQDRTVVVTVAEELANGVGSEQIMFPPRTGTSPQTTWTLAATTDPQTVTHHEYFEWRYV